MLRKCCFFNVFASAARCRVPTLSGFAAALVFSVMLSLWSSAAAAETIRLTGKLARGFQDTVTLNEIDQTGVIEELVYNPHEKLEVQYSGVLLDRFVDRYGDPSVTAIRMTAIDDYRITFERAEWENFRIMLATKMRGERFGLEKRGPARVVFIDFNPDEETYREKISKWIWMIEEIKFE